MAPAHFTISLGLVLNTLVDAKCLSAAYIFMGLDIKLNENVTFLIRFILFYTK